MQRPGGLRSRTYLKVQKELPEIGAFLQKKLLKDMAGDTEGAIDHFRNSEDCASYSHSDNEG